MAEIIVEPDKKNNNNNPIWPWILGLLLLVGVIWAAVELLGDDEPEREMAAVETPVIIEEERVVNEDVAYYGPVQEYVNFVQSDASNNPDMGLDHEYTSEGIQKLKTALVAIADEQAAGDVNIEQKKETLNQAADNIQTDPMSTEHANSIKSAFTAAADLMDALQERSFPNLNNDVQEVQDAANSIETGTQTLNQKDQVKEFFKESSEALQAMADTPTNR